MRKLTDEQKIEIVEKYKTGNYTLVKLAKEYNVSHPSIDSILKVRKVTKNNLSKVHRKYNIDDDYFNIIDTEEKAYFLGLLYADGYNDEKHGRVELGLQEEDRHILEDFNKAINHVKPLYFRNLHKESNNKKNTFNVQICSYKISSNLANLGCFQRKSLTLKFPTEQQVPKHLIVHFIRGYYDGDGCLSVYYDGNHWKCYFCSIVSTEDFCIKFQEIVLKETGVKFGIRRQNKGSTTTTRQARVGGRLVAYRFLDWLYQDATIYLKRKHDKYIEHRQDNLEKMVGTH